MHFLFIFVVLLSNSYYVSLQEMNWNGMLQGSLFKRPKANVIMTVVGHDGVDESPLKPKSIARYPVHNVSIIQFLPVNICIYSRQKCLKIFFCIKILLNFTNLLCLFHLKVICDCISGIFFLGFSYGC